MLRSALVLALVFGAGPPIPAQDPSRAIEGVVVDARTGTPIAGALVTLVQAVRTTRTDAHGAFQFGAVPAGSYTLNVSLIGYAFARRTVTVTAAADLDVTIPLSEGTGAYRETVNVVPAPADAAVPGVASQSELGSAALQDLRSVAADDPMRAVQALPGVATGDDFQAQFSVRGSQFRHVGVVLDGTATPLMLHTVRSTNDTASIAMINTDVLDAASLMAGAHPQRHGDWLGATLDFSLREGSRDRAAYRAAASATTASFVGEGPIGGGRGAWLASVRRSYIDWLVRKLYPSIDGTLGFTDTQIKLTYDLTPRQQIQFVAIAGEAGFRNDRASLANGIRKASSTNVLASGLWRLTKESWLLSQRLSIVQSRFTDLGRVDQELGHGTGRSAIWRADASWLRSPRWSVDAGVKSEWQRQTVDQHNYALVGGKPQLRFTASSVSSTTLASAWAQLNRHGSHTGGSVGARVTRDSLSGRGVVSPWLLGEHSAGPLVFRASAGITHQFAELEIQRGLPERRPERAEMIDASVGSPLPRGFHWQTTAFWRKERDVIRRTGEDRLVDGLPVVESIFPEFSSALSGRTRGIDLVVGRKAASGLTGWLAYTYARTTVQDRLTGEHFPGDFDQRHTLNAFVQERLSYRTAISAKLRIGSNFPISGYLDGSLDALRLGAERNTIRLPVYARLDVRANRTYTFDRRRLTLFLELVNVTGRSNLGQRPGFIDGRTLEAENYTQKLLPFLPSAGVLIEF